MQQLEQISRSYQGAPRDKNSQSYGRIELYALGATSLYTAPLGGFGGGLGGGLPIGGMFEKMEHFAASRPIGSSSSFEKGSPGNIIQKYNFGEFTLQERFDAKDPDNIHLNYDILGLKGKDSRGILGSSHSFKLFDKDD